MCNVPCVLCGDSDDCDLKDKILCSSPARIDFDLSEFRINNPHSDSGKSFNEILKERFNA